MPSISHLLNRTTTLKREGTTDDGQGGFTTALTTVSTPRGRRFSARGSDRQVVGREEAIVSHVWYFDFGLDIRVRDVIEEGEVSYEVLAVLLPSLDDYIKIQAKEIQVG